MTFAFGAALLGILLIYAGVKGLSVRRLLVGDNQTPIASNTSLLPSSSTGSSSGGSGQSAAPSPAAGGTPTVGTTTATAAANAGLLEAIKAAIGAP